MVWSAISGGPPWKPEALGPRGVQLFFGPTFLYALFGFAFQAGKRNLRLPGPALAHAELEIYFLTNVELT